jgi:hypothetical protein
MVQCFFLDSFLVVGFFDEVIALVTDWEGWVGCGVRLVAFGAVVGSHCCWFPFGYYFISEPIKPYMSLL